MSDDLYKNDLRVYVRSPSLGAALWQEAKARGWQPRLDHTIRDRATYFFFEHNHNKRHLAGSRRVLDKELLDGDVPYDEQNHIRMDVRKDWDAILAWLDKPAVEMYVADELQRAIGKFGCQKENVTALIAVLDKRYKLN